MSNYKHNTLSDRDALFGSSGATAGRGGGGSKNKRQGKQGSGRATTAARPSTSSNNIASKSSIPSTTTTTTPAASTAKGYQPKKTTTTTTTSSKKSVLLVGEAKIAKIAEAKEYREKAKKAMQRGVFSKADPVAASMYYKRAADAYQMVGDVRLERIHRVASADCQMHQGAYATAAADYTRAAELLQQEEKSSSLNMEQTQQEACQLHLQAANAFTQMGEMGKAAECMVHAALALAVWNGNETTVLSKEALAKMEQAVEAHVPDPLNRYARYRQLGISAFIDPEAAATNSSSAEVMALAKDHMVTRAYAYEPLHKLVNVFCHHQEYASALYATGAATAMLEADGISTRTLSKNYVMETILLLAMGDPVAAERAFLDWHVQKTFYLTSRECKLAEELVRAILSRDIDALEEARSPTGSNRAALANVDESMRILVQQLRISGVARSSKPSHKAPSAKARKQVDEELQILRQTTLEEDAPQVVTAAAAAAAAAAAIPATSARKNSGSESEDSSDDDDDDDDDGEKMDTAALHAEMDNLMNDLGLEDDSSSQDDDGLEDDDDDIDLR